MHDYGGDISEDPRTSLKGLLSLRSYSLAVQKHKLCSDGCEAKKKSKNAPQWAITWSWKIHFFPISFHIIQNVLLIPIWILSRALSRLLNSLQDHAQPRARIHRWKCSPYNPLSTPPPFPSCIQLFQADRAVPMSAPWMNQYFHFNTVSIFN